MHAILQFSVLIVLFFSAFAITADTITSFKLWELQILACFLPALIFLITNILVSDLTVFLVLFTPFCKRRQSVFSIDVMGGKTTINLKEMHKNRKRRTYAHWKRTRSVLSR
jgi:hypothetical protein